MPPRKRRPAPAADDFDTSGAIQEMRTDYLQCRDFGHTWRPFTARWVPKERLYQVQLRCSRCRSIREREIGQNGQRLGNHYDYADGYLISGLGRLDESGRNLIRLTSVLRVLPEDADEDEG